MPTQRTDRFAFYFPHDSNARNDPRCIKLRRLQGWAAYGFYWAVVEMLRESQNYKLPLNLTEDLIFDLHGKPEFFATMFEVGLLKKDEEFFWSDSLVRRMSHMDDRREKARAAGVASAQRRMEAKATDVQRTFNERCSDAQPYKTNINIKQNKTKRTSESHVDKSCLVQTKAQIGVCSTGVELGHASPLMKSGVLEEAAEETPVNPAKERMAYKKNEKIQVEVEIPESLNRHPLFIKTWGDWLTHLREKKCKPTKSALCKQLDVCCAIGPDEAVKVIEVSIQNNWQGLFPRTPKKVNEEKSVFQIVKDWGNESDVK